MADRLFLLTGSMQDANSRQVDTVMERQRRKSEPCLTVKMTVS